MRQQPPRAARTEDVEDGIYVSGTNGITPDNYATYSDAMFTTLASRYGKNTNVIFQDSAELMNWNGGPGWTDDKRASDEALVDNTIRQYAPNSFQILWGF